LTGGGGGADRAGAPDPLALVLGALGFGTAAGVGFQALVTWGVRSLQAGALPSAAPPGLSSLASLVLLIGTLAGIVSAGLATWTLLAPIRNPWRQAMLAIIAGLGSFVLSLVTIPLDRAYGRPGLLGLAALAVALCILIGRRLPLARGAA
jgi:hypothetical protein